MSVHPLVVGPPQGCQPLCLGCYKKLDLDDNAYRCEGCGWPMCSQGCSGRGREYGHSGAECQLYERVRPKLLAADSNALTPLYLVVVPLRCLLLQQHDPDKWHSLLTMEAHNDIRQKLPVIWRNNQENVVDRIRKEWGMTQYEEDLIHTICGILEVNAFEVGQEGVSIRALYPCAFYMAHDCVPNTGHTDDKNFQLRVRATTKINKGSSIYLSYAYTLQGTLKRRDHLKESKFFDCTCARCSDATELGTYAGALKCPQCAMGIVVSTAPLNRDADWCCTNDSCTGYTVPARSVRLLMDKIGDEVEALDESSIPTLEAFLTRYQNVLHPNHYHCLGVQHSLCQLYGKAPGFLINDMTEAQLRHKRDLCRQLLKVVDVLEPGYSRLRGVLLYELHAPLMILTTRGVEAHALAYRDLRSRLKEVAACLEESSIILNFEPETSNEGMMGRAAKDALMRVREWQRIITNS
ncbi:protein msta-like isoform X2 [Zootermopsis nevadensis]|nr:protein msta-like isoform X2 [Zootermopsis nevadensis]